MKKRTPKHDEQALVKLSRREQEIMDIVFRHEHVSCSDVKLELSDPPSYSAVRAMLNKLVEKKYLDCKLSGKKYLYYPLVPIEKASAGALRRLVRTFFGGNASGAIVALLNDDEGSLNESEIRELEKLLREKRTTSVKTSSQNPQTKLKRAQK
ncbi:MAG: BlaI/MecI/CopY family transcriptional regulator [Pirellulaceae bacterium]